MRGKEALPRRNRIFLSSLSLSLLFLVSASLLPRSYLGRHHSREVLFDDLIKATFLSHFVWCPLKLSLKEYYCFYWHLKAVTLQSCTCFHELFSIFLPSGMSNTNLLSRISPRWSSFMCKAIAARSLSTDTRAFLKLNTWRESGGCASLCWKSTGGESTRWWRCTPSKKHGTAS